MYHHHDQDSAIESDLREVDSAETAPNSAYQSPRALDLPILLGYNPCDEAREKNKPGCRSKKAKWPIRGVAESAQHVRRKMIRSHQHEAKTTECIYQKI